MFERLTDALVSLSIANLCFALIWVQLWELAGDRSVKYFESHAPDIGLVWALIVDVLLLAGAIWLAFLLGRTTSRVLRWTAKAIIVFFSLFAVYQLQRSLRPSFDAVLTAPEQAILKGALALVILFMIVRYPTRASQLAKGAFKTLSPLFLVMIGSTLWLYATNDLRTRGRGKAAGMLSAAVHTNRLIWIIFDELDDRMLFQARPARIHPVEFDRLRQESIYAQVRTPAGETRRSMPSLLLGRRVTDTKLNTSKLLVTLEGDSGWVDFASQPNVFRTARAQGFNTALIGWHHPYCRILGNDLSDCAWDSAGTESISVERHLRPRSLAEKALFLATWQSRSVPFMLEPQLDHESHIAVMRYQIPNIKRMLQNRNLNLVLLHLVVPHPPGIWDTTGGTFTTGKSDYIDNLQLASNTLGQIRRDLEKTGDWDRSTILVSSDHPYRPTLWESLATHRTAEMVQETGMKAYPYVPFLLKLPSQHKEALYDGEFNSVLTSDLILQLLNGNLPTAEDTVNWLHAHTKSFQNSSSQRQRSGEPARWNTAGREEKNQPTGK